MTAGEDLVWAAVYASYWTARREAQRKYGGDRSDLDMAGEAAAQADRAVAAMVVAVPETQPTEAT